MRGRLCAIALVALGLFFASPSVASDIRRIEAVGAVPIRQGERARVGPKEAAIDAALREAVFRVARDFLIDADEGSGGAGRAPIEGTLDDPQLVALKPALGSDMVRYTRSFRIIEDRGEGPALFVEDGSASTEYVVIVEVQVDAGRVEKRLVQRGLIGRRTSTGQLRQVRLEVMGLDQYAAYEQLRGLIIEQLGARSVRPVELERGRSVLTVSSGLAPAELLHRLLALTPPNMEISPLAAASDSVRLSIYWTPPEGSEPSAAAAPDASRRSRR